MSELDGEVYAKHADELTRFATTLVGPSDAEDVMASAVVGAMRSVTWSEVRDPRAYLYRAVLNEARMRQRAGVRRRRREAAAAAPDTQPDSHLSMEVRDAVDRLSVRARSVLHLAYWHDMTVEEISRTLGLSRRSTERALTEARRTLEEELS